MNEEADPINSRNLIEEAWIKLANDKGVIHALRTLVNEEVRSSIVTDKEWEEFKSLISAATSKTEIHGLSKFSENPSACPPLWVHLVVWLFFSSLLVAAWVWWLGHRRGWWGQPNCLKCNIPVEKRNARCNFLQPPDRQLSTESIEIVEECKPIIEVAHCKINIPVESGSRKSHISPKNTISKVSKNSRDSFSKESFSKCFTSTNRSEDSILSQISRHGSRLNSHSVEKCMSTCQRSQKSHSTSSQQNATKELEVQEDCIRSSSNMISLFMESNFKGEEEEEPLEFKGEFKKFFNLEQSTYETVDFERMNESDDNTDYKMWFVIGLIFCLAMTTLLCAVQLINLEEKYLTLSKHATRCRTFFQKDRKDYEQQNEVTAAFSQEDQSYRGDDHKLLPIPTRVMDVSEIAIPTSVRSKHKHSKKISESHIKTLSKEEGKLKKKHTKSRKSENSSNETINGTQRSGTKMLKKITGTTEMLKPWLMKD